MKWIVGITAIVVILGMHYGVRLAWLRTPAMLYTQVLLFPILVGACIYVLFIAKRGTRTGYQIAMSRIREKTGRIHYAVWGVLGAILLPAGLRSLCLRGTSLGGERSCYGAFCRCFPHRRYPQTQRSEANFLL